MRRHRPGYRKPGTFYLRTPIPPPPVNGYAITLVSPVNGGTVRVRRPNVEFIPISVLGDPVDIQIEWRTTPPRIDPDKLPLIVWVPDPTYTQELEALSSGDVHSFQPPTDLGNRSWYYRLRAGSLATNIWGDWTQEDRYLNVISPIGSATAYLDLNIGAPRPTTMGAVIYSDMNIGLDFADHMDLSAAYSDLNVGILPELVASVVYSDLNIHPVLRAMRTAVYSDLNIDTSQPDPTIWWIRPEEGKEGYVFNIYGHGFGDFQGQYGGKVRLGNLVCAISRWEKVPAELRTGTVVVSGKPRAVSSTTALPYVLLSTEQRTVQAGDIIEYDMQWDYPVGSRLDVFPYFTVSGSSSPIGYGSALLNDTTGDPWISDQPEAMGAWHHRRFVVPTGSFLVGRTITNFGIGWYGFASDTPTRTARVRSFVVRRADETPTLWITGDDQTSSPALTYVANTGVLDYTEFDQEGHVIHHGQALDPDVITPEHGWIVAVVPPGAVSSMVQVSLEED